MKCVCVSFMILLGLIYVILHVIKHKKNTAKIVFIKVCISFSLFLLSIISIIVFDVLFISIACVFGSMIILMFNLIDHAELKPKEEKEKINDQSKKTK